MLTQARNTSSVYSTHPVSKNSAPSFAAVLLTLAALGVSGLLGIDSISNPDKTLGLLGAPSYRLIVPFLLMQAGLNLGWKITVNKQVIQIIQWLLLPVLIIVTTILTTIDATSPLNTVFTLTRLHQSRLGVLVVFWIGLILLNQSHAWWKVHKKKVLLSAPALAFAIGLWVRWWPWNVYLEIVKENHLIENLQYVALALTACWTVTRIPRQLQRGWYLAVLLTVIVTLGLSFIAGDEIAWMQHHLDYPTPTAFTDTNQQAETTIHNLESVGRYMEYAYLALTAFGTFSWTLITVSFPARWKHLRDLAPQPSLALYFGIAFAYMLNNYLQGGGQYKAWSEPVELVLYIGLGLWIVQLVTRELLPYLKPRT